MLINVEGVVLKGHLPPTEGRKIVDAIRRNEGKRVRVSVSEAVELASDKQRKYYFSVIVSAYQSYFAKQGKYFTKDQMHDSMMRSIGGFSNPYVNPFSGEPDPGRISYNSLTKKQTEGYHTLCRQYGAENYGLDIPEPNEEAA